MYAGLFSFTALIMYGLTGLIDVVRPPWQEREKPPTTEELVAFEAPTDLDDMAMAQLIYETLDLPLTGPPKSYSVKRDESRRLVVKLYTPNGFRTMTLLEDEGQVLVVRSHAGWESFVAGRHGALLKYAAPRFVTRAWAYYNEAGLWSLGFMSLSGVALWLATRPGYRWAQAAFLSGNAAFLTLYWLLR